MKAFGILLMLVGFLMIMTGGCALDSASLGIPASTCVIGMVFLGFGTKVITCYEN